MKKQAVIWYAVQDRGWGIYIEESYKWDKTDTSLFIKQIYGNCEKREKVEKVVKQQIEDWKRIHHFSDSQVVVVSTGNSEQMKLAKNMASLAEKMVKEHHETV